MPEYPESPEPLSHPGSIGTAGNPYERLAAGLAEVTGAPAPPDEPVRAEEPVQLIGGGSAEDRPVWPPRPARVPAEDPASARPSWRGQAPPFLADGAVRAAGGVVWSRWGRQLRVLLIHRPKYDDWSLPKGKADPGESDTACALREVKEETGLSCSLGDELGSIGYTDRHGRPKTVRYWAMQPVGGSFAPHAEVDQIRWLSVDEAARLCSYQRDAEVLAGFAASQET